MFAALKRLRKRFYDGPRYVGYQPRNPTGYRSPTLIGLQWIRALAVTYLTLPGRLLIVAAGMILMFSMYSFTVPVHLLSLMLGSLFAVDILTGVVMRPKVDVRRNAPTRVQAGAVFTVDYTVTNLGRRPAFDLLPDCLPLPKDLVRLTRPFVAEVGPGESVRTQSRIMTGNRGRYILPAQRVAFTFPFDLWRWGRMTEGIRPLIVYPTFTPLRHMEIGGAARYQAGGIALSSKVGESMEFIGCREFRDGDDPRRIHWPSWARTTYPVVKEFVEERFSRTALVIDTYRPGRTSLGDFLRRPTTTPAFEAAVSLAAAVTDYLAEQEYIVDLFAAGPQVYRFQSGRSLAYLSNILDILACLSFHPQEPFAEFSEELLAEIQHINSVVMILITWNKVREELLLEIGRRGVDLKAFLVTAPGQEPPAGLPSTIRVVGAEDIRGGRCAML